MIRRILVVTIGVTAALAFAAFLNRSSSDQQLAESDRLLNANVETAHQGNAEDIPPESRPSSPIEHPDAVRNAFDWLRRETTCETRQFRASARFESDQPQSIRPVIEMESVVKLVR